MDKTTSTNWLITLKMEHGLREGAKSQLRIFKKALILKKNAQNLETKAMKFLKETDFLPVEMYI